jgi:hypothetical protein
MLELCRLRESPVINVGGSWSSVNQLEEEGGTYISMQRNKG